MVKTKKHTLYENNMHFMECSRKFRHMPLHPMQCLPCLASVHIFLIYSPDQNRLKMNNDQQVHPLPLGRGASSGCTLLYCRRPYISASLCSSISSLCSTNFREIARNTSSTPDVSLDNRKPNTSIIFGADFVT